MSIDISQVILGDQIDSSRPAGSSDLRHGGPLNPLPMLRCVKQNGESSSFGYSYLYRVDFNGSDTIRLHFMNDVVTIVGHNLAPLVDAIESHAQREIVEVDEMRAAQRSDRVIVVQISSGK
jgi:hypothetical protein